MDQVTILAWPDVVVAQFSAWGAKLSGILPNLAGAVVPLTAFLAAAGFSVGLAFALGARPIVTHTSPATSSSSRYRAIASSRSTATAASSSASAPSTRCSRTATAAGACPTPSCWRGW